MKSEAIQSISDRYRLLLQDKLKLLHREAAEKATYDQIVMDARCGTAGVEPTVEFLIQFEMTRGKSEQGARNFVLPLFNLTP
jgi:hypothetical protein